MASKTVKKNNPAGDIPQGRALASMCEALGVTSSTTKEIRKRKTIIQQCVPNSYFCPGTDYNKNGLRWRKAFTY